MKMISISKVNILIYSKITKGEAFCYLGLYRCIEDDLIFWRDLVVIGVTSRAPVIK